MSRFSDRPNTALMVIDVQNGVVANAHDRDQVVANIRSLVDKARANQVPVVWVQPTTKRLAKRDSDDWRYVPELTREDDEPLVHKHYGDSFEDTDLEAVLAERGVGRLVTGAQTDECVRSTLHGAFVRGYDTDRGRRPHHRGPEPSGGAGAGQGDRPHQPVLEQPVGASAPGRTAGVVETAEVEF